MAVTFPDASPGACGSRLCCWLSTLPSAAGQVAVAVNLGLARIAWPCQLHELSCLDVEDIPRQWPSQTQVQLVGVGVELGVAVT